MKELNTPKFLIYAVFRAVRHPRTLIVYFYCADCKVRFNANEKVCPKCHAKVGESPGNIQESPIPWWGSVIVICLGIIVLILGGILSIPGLDRLGDALIFIPLGNLFGMSLHR